MRSTILIIISFLHFFNSYSQRSTEPTDNDLALAKKLKETYEDDNIAIIESKDYISIDLEKQKKLVTVLHTKNQQLINIESRADIQVFSFYDGESQIDAFEIQYKNGRDARFDIKDEAYNSDDLFHNDVRVKYAAIDFPLLGYRYGTVIHKKYNDIKYFTKLYFHDIYPTVKKEIKIEVPNWLNLELKEMNFDGYNIKKSNAKNKKGDATIYTYTIEDIPAMYKESNAPGPTYIYPHLLILSKSFELNDETVNLFDSTQDLYNWYKSLVDELENDNEAIVSKVGELTAKASSDEEKIKNIYYWVQDNIRYIAFEDGIAGFKPDEASNVYNKRYGDCKGMANLLKQMLKIAGFDARLTWIGTKHIAYDYSTPNLSVDNHMICTIIDDNGKTFLDGTEKFNALGEYADRIQGKQVLIEDGESFILETVPISDAEFNTENINYNMKLVDDELVGEVIKNFKGESRSQLLYYFNNLKNDKKEDFLEWYLNRGNSNIKVSNINTTDLLNRDEDIDISYDIKIKNAVSDFDNTLYIDLDLEKELSNHRLEKRKTNYIFGSKKNLESTINLEIPSGYKITHIPSDLEISSKNYDLKVDFENTGNTLTYTKHFKIKNAKIETTDFEEWNSFISKLNDIYNEQIILTKQ